MSNSPSSRAAHQPRSAAHRRDGGSEAVSAQISDASDATALVDQARRAIDRVVAHDPALGPIAENLATVSFALAEASSALSSYLGGLDADGARELEAVQERRAELASLIRRYGPTLDDVLATLESGSRRLLELDGDSDRIVALEAEVAAELARVDDLASRITHLRRVGRSAPRGGRVGGAPRPPMPDARLAIDVAERELSLTGRDQVTLLLQPHPGAEPRPIAKGASGGELSRVMLAIEVVLASSKPGADPRLRRSGRGRRGRECHRDRASTRASRGVRSGRS